MPEYLAQTPCKFTIWSREIDLIKTNLLVNAHPLSTVGRLLQYIHYQVYKQLRAIHQPDEQCISPRSKIPLNSINAYFLSYDGKELPPTCLLKDITPSGHLDSNHFIRLQLEKSTSSSGSAFNLDYDMDAEFNSMNIQFEINTLSSQRIFNSMESNLPIGTTLVRLEKLALERIKSFEKSTGNLCGIKEEHSVSDFQGFIIKGKQTPMFLNYGSDSDYYKDLNLVDLLGIDFAPAHSSFFTFLFKMNHEQGSRIANDEGGFVLEFISDATLSITQMNVQPETTVKQVKDFICSVYTHSLSLTRNDIKLIYKGQLLHENNFAGNSSKISEYIKEPHEVKVHVQINQEYTESGPGFWNEVFNNPNIFQFMPSDTRSQSPVNFVPAQEQAPTVLLGNDQDMQYVTESGKDIIVSTDELYRKCIINGNEVVFIPINVLNSQSSYLSVNRGDHNEIKIPISASDYKIDGNNILLSSSAMDQLESAMNCKIERIHNSIVVDYSNEHVQHAHNTAPTNHTTDENDEPARNNRVLRPLRNSFPLLLVLIRTFYLIGYNSLVPFFIILEFGSFLPWKYIILLSLLFIFRTIWNTQEVWNLWRDYFHLNEIDEAKFNQIKEFINTGSLTLNFYKKCKDTQSVIDLLMIPNLHEQRLSVYSKYDIEYDTNTPDVEQLRLLFIKVLSGEIPKDALDDLFRGFFELYESTRNMNPLYPQDSLNELLLMIWKESNKKDINTLPKYRRWFQIVCSQINSIAEHNIMDVILAYIIPDPANDRVITAVIKNFVLFWVSLLPFVKERLDVIVVQRARDREQPVPPVQEEGNQEERDQEEAVLIPDQEPTATGVQAQLHVPDED
ncbi:usa1p [Saccharomyces arboricola H-6]|uniref:Usa1p n=1 Tax=Saccharomyces arboricola (strain H-6 / AS 2.3317 / CBS 10644) TaxID=1160507 RepID=J8Q4C0_SACAR|nr:usa1p [Saccharomyces arboricola H-6]